MYEQRRLERNNGIIIGLCGGIAARFGVSPFIIHQPDSPNITVAGRIARAGSLRATVDPEA